VTPTVPRQTTSPSSTSTAASKSKTETDEDSIDVTDLLKKQAEQQLEAQRLTSLFSQSSNGNASPFLSLFGVQSGSDESRVDMVTLLYQQF
jgi:hypothetical protein